MIFVLAEVKESAPIRLISRHGAGYSLRALAPWPPNFFGSILLGSAMRRVLS